MILWLTCTHGRMKCLQRNLQSYIDQIWQGPSIMFICNSGAPMKLSEDVHLPDNKKVYIDNCSMMNFTSVGEKYTHTLKLAMELYPEIDIVCSSDDDDIFMPTHLTEGWFGINRAWLSGKEAYKPKQSIFRYKEGDRVKYTCNENTYEPSIFVSADWIQEKGYAPVSIKYHQQWLDPLTEQGKLLVDPHGIPTLIYNWGDDWQVYKMSGSGHDNYNNFVAHARVSQDMGNGILTPTGDNSIYYSLTETISPQIQNLPII